jgi:hypothetical protein
MLHAALIAACFLMFPVFTAAVLLLTASHESEPGRESEPERDEVPVAAVPAFPLRS